MEIDPAKLAGLFACVVIVMGGCAVRNVPDPGFTCRVLKESPNLIDRSSTRDLDQLSRGTPAHPRAHSAYAQKIASTTLGSVGTAALLAGLIEGFIVDSSQPGVRAAGYGLVGGAIALFATALTLVSTGRIATERARMQMRAFRDLCP